MQSLDCSHIAITFRSKLGYQIHGRVRNINENFLSTGDTTRAGPVGYDSILSMVHQLFMLKKRVVMREVECTGNTLWPIPTNLESGHLI
jgi:hypothetical protein